MPGGIQSEPIYVVIDTNVTTTLLVAGVAGKRLRVISLLLASNSGLNAFALRNVSAGTRIIGPVSVADDTNCVLPYSPAGWGQSAEGDGINLLLGSATGVGGQLVYVEVE